MICVRDLTPTREVGHLIVYKWVQTLPYKLIL